MAGSVAQPVPGYGNTGVVKKNPSIFDVYGGAVTENTGNYDELMNAYRKQLGAGPATRPLVAPQVTAQTTPYQQSGDVTAALGNLKSLADTGGYSDQNIADIRARGISPIRSVYASAQQNLDRNKTLQGGYSPGYAAATAKMARELSGKISEATTNVNAGIAQQVASNRLQAAPQYGSLASGEEGRNLNIGQANAESINRMNQYNAGNQLNVDQQNNQLGSAEQQRQLEILNQMKSLYGTTPANAQLFGNQVVQQQQVSNQDNQFRQGLRNRTGMGMVGAINQGMSV